MTIPTASQPSLSKSIVDQIELVLREADESQRPLEMDPYRSQLFELFVMADAADLVSENPSKPEAEEAKGHENRLTADGL